MTTKAILLVPGDRAERPFGARRRGVDGCLRRWP
jgi:hypothetical protein